MAWQSLRIWFIALFAVALVPRLLLLALNADRLEAWEYDTLAQHIVSGQGYTIERFGHVAYAFGDGNLYSFLAATVYLVVGDQRVVLGFVQAVLASLAAPVIFEVGRRAFDLRVAALGGVLAALHPGLLAYTLKLHPLGLDVLLMATSVLWIQRVADGRSQLMTGFALGISLMTRPTFFLAQAVAFGVRWLSTSLRSHLMVLVAPLVVALAIAAPWVIRNWAVLGRPVFISTSFEDVWKGNNPLASGSSYLPSGTDIFAASPPELQERFLQSNELELNDVFATEVRDFVTSHPSEFVSLTVRKFGYFFWGSPQLGLFYPSIWMVAYQIYYALAAAFALLGVFAIVKAGSEDERSLLRTLVAISLTLAVIHALSYVEGRHRWGIEPLLLLVSARGAFALVTAGRAAFPRKLSPDSFQP